ncbi:hypothetical protein B0O99DRAFT_731363, partial [Bisporella sp. PMI_857]
KTHRHTTIISQSSQQSTPLLTFKTTPYHFPNFQQHFPTSKMRFTTITVTFLGLCASAVFANDSLEQREAEIVEYDIPLHARDFTIITKRGKKCKLGRKRDVLSKRVGVEMNEVESSTTNVEVEGVNGCAGVFIWADKIYGLHTPDDDFVADVAKLKNAVTAAKIPQITHVAVSAADTTDSNALKGLLTWTGKTVAVRNYPYVASNNRNLFTLSATFANKGSVTIRNDPLSKSPTPESSSSGSRSSSKSRKGGKRSVRVEDDE